MLAEAAQEDRTAARKLKAGVEGSSTRSRERTGKHRGKTPHCPQLFRIGFDLNSLESTLNPHEGISDIVAASVGSYGDGTFEENFLRHC